MGRGPARPGARAPGGHPGPRGRPAAADLECLPRAWRVAHAEAKFGLRSAVGRDDNTAARQPGVKEQVTAERAGRRTPPRDVLRQRVKAAAGASRGFTEFTEVLAAAG